MSAPAHAEERHVPPSGTARRDAVPRDHGGGDGRVWPVAGHAGLPRVARGWKPPPKPWAAGHRGVDLAAPPGSAVRAVASGRVSFAGRVAGRWVVSVELAGTGHPPLRMTYEPVRPSVHRGDRVRAGQTVGKVAGGPFHCDSGCLHWGALRGRRYLDPLSLLRGGPSRLLPVFGVPVPGHARNVGPGGTAGAGSGPGAGAGTAAARRADAERHPVVNRAAVTDPAVTGQTLPDLGRLSLAAGLGCAACWARRRLSCALRCPRAGRRRRGCRTMTGRGAPQEGGAQPGSRSRPPPRVSCGRR
ncbi:murein hydrolase activator EnvC [Streptomyces sp. WMMB 322]|uniref:murein hydrolase activator EnvC family protein n=1 Tax=Streptomyces sp. WMMB 322 TaxID=1286821 RepID=UPI00099E60E6|nr:M23 family metallopeptidase [Streptomyces sp. WMMB 322]